MMKQFEPLDGARLGVVKVKARNQQIALQPHYLAHFLPIDDQMSS
jgi:hypothetical protein